MYCAIFFIVCFFTIVVLAITCESTVPVRVRAPVYVGLSSLLLWFQSTQTQIDFRLWSCLSLQICNGASSLTAVIGAIKTPKAWRGHGVECVCMCILSAGCTYFYMQNHFWSSDRAWMFMCLGLKRPYKHQRPKNKIEVSSERITSCKWLSRPAGHQLVAYTLHWHAERILGAPRGSNPRDPQSPSTLSPPFEDSAWIPQRCSLSTISQAPLTVLYWSPDYKDFFTLFSSISKSLL